MMILGLLQARTSSTRLPGKVLKPILGEAMLLHQIRRLRRSRLLDALVVATSDDATDDAVAALCEQHDVSISRGSLDDVLDRMYRAALPYRPDAVVRLTGDCPLADWQVLDAVITRFLEGDVDYVNNMDPPTFPHGLDVEVMSFAAFEEAHENATDPAEREHVTLYIRNRPERFRLATVTAETDRSHMRWTVDEPADFEKVNRIYERLYPAKPDFLSADVIELLATEPDLDAINDAHRLERQRERARGAGRGVGGLS